MKPAPADLSASARTGSSLVGVRGCGHTAQPAPPGLAGQWSSAGPSPICQDSRRATARPLSWLPLLLLAAGCVTETGNPELDVELRATATSSTDRVAVSSLPALTVDQAWVNIEEVRLVQAEVCDTPPETEHEVEGPFPTDLVAEPADTIRIPAVEGNYCRLRVDLEKGESGALSDLSIFVTGSRADGVPFEIRTEEGFELEVRGAGDGFSLDESGRQLLLGFDMSAWLGDIGLEEAVPEGGVVLVDEDHDTVLLEAFEEAVEAALGLWDDHDGDGDLDDEDDRLDDD